MGRFLFLRNTVELPAAIAAPPAGHAIRVLDQYDLREADLDGIDGLLVSQHGDERHLAECRSWLDAYLDRGGAIAVNGPVAIPYCDGLSAHVAEPGGRAEDWRLVAGEPHPIFDGVAAGDVDIRRGVVGFWARGGFVPPPGAIALTRFAKSGRPVDLAWERPRGGRLFLHPGNDVWGYASDPTPAARIFPQLLAWMEMASMETRR